jgi:hypothetical protein
VQESSAIWGNGTVHVADAKCPSIHSNSKTGPLKNTMAGMPQHTDNAVHASN